jgi:hypothetical protein
VRLSRTNQGPGDLAWRIEESSQLISLWIAKATWTRDGERGHIHWVVFRNIRAKADPLRVELKGVDQTHAAVNVLFEDVVVNGKPLGSSDAKTNTFVQRVSTQVGLYPIDTERRSGGY